MTDHLNPDAWDRVASYLGRDALTQLANRTVAVVGLGSGGGFSALSLAMSGVGHFVLIDDDTLELTNIVRHVADRRYLHMPKVDVLADLIRQRNPQAQVDTVQGRLEDHADKLKGVDLVVVGVDGERAKYTINDICRANGLTAVYAGVYERGEGGDVVVIRPTPDSPCYACWAQQLRDATPEVSGPEGVELDYGLIGPDGTLTAEPGLWIHVVRVASAQADRALHELLIGQPSHRAFPANTVILANVEMEIFEGVIAQPYTAQWIDIKRDPHCLVCGQRDTTAGATDLSLADLIGGMRKQPFDLASSDLTDLADLTDDSSQQQPTQADLSGDNVHVE